IGRDPYKGDIFKLFADAYRSGYFDDSSRPGLGADALCDILQVRWLANREHEEKRKHLLDQLLPMWREWQYGWDKYPKGENNGNKRATIVANKGRDMRTRGAKTKPDG